MTLAALLYHQKLELLFEAQNLNENHLSQSCIQYVWTIKRKKDEGYASNMVKLISLSMSVEKAKDCRGLFSWLLAQSANSAPWRLFS